MSQVERSPLCTIMTVDCTVDCIVDCPKGTVVRSLGSTSEKSQFILDKFDVTFALESIRLALSARLDVFLIKKSSRYQNSNWLPEQDGETTTHF